MAPQPSETSGPVRPAATNATVPNGKSSGAQFHTFDFPTGPAQLPESLFPITSQGDLVRKLYRLFVPDVYAWPTSAESSATTSHLPLRKKSDESV